MKEVITFRLDLRLKKAIKIASVKAGKPNTSLFILEVLKGNKLVKEELLQNSLK